MKNPVNDRVFGGVKINADDLEVTPNATAEEEPKDSYKPDSDLERANRKQKGMANGFFYYG